MSISNFNEEGQIQIIRNGQYVQTISSTVKPLELIVHKARNYPKPKYMPGTWCQAYLLDKVSTVQVIRIEIKLTMEEGKEDREEISYYCRHGKAVFPIKESNLFLLA